MWMVGSDAAIIGIFQSILKEYFKVNSPIWELCIHGTSSIWDDTAYFRQALK